MISEDESMDEIEEDIVEEPTEDTNEEPSEEASVEPTKKPKRKEDIPKAVCSVCGELVTPIVIPTDRGIRNRCPNCKKFMKPLPPEEARLATSKTPVDDEADVLIPDNVRRLNIVTSMLRAELGKIYGIPRTNKTAVVEAIVDTISHETIAHPIKLHYHIKEFASQVNEKHLEALIRKIYNVLREEGYYGVDDRPSYSPSYDRPGYSEPRYGSSFDDRYGYDERRDDRVPSRHSTEPMIMLINGVPVTTYDPQVYMAWQRDKREQEKAEQDRREHDLRMKKLESQIGGKGGSSETVPVPNPNGEGTIDVPVFMLPFYLKGDSDELKKEIAELRKQTAEAKDEANEARMERMMDIVDQFRNQPSVLEQIQGYKQMGIELGLAPTGRTTIDLFADGMSALDNRLGQLVDRMPPVPALGDEGFEGQVTRTPSERAAKAKEIIDNIERSEGIIEAEDALIAAARKVHESSD